MLNRYKEILVFKIIMDFINRENFSNFNIFLNKYFSETSHDKVMLLSIYVDEEEDPALKNIYLNAAQNHNNKLLADPHFYDAGFDLFLPKNTKNNNIISNGGTHFFKKDNQTQLNINKVNFKVKCCAKMYNKEHNFFYTPFYTYARSSISKSPLRLANNQGIIDAGYRGPLIGMFDCIYSDDLSNNEINILSDWFIEDYARLLQICAPSLVPVYVQIVDNMNDLGPSTSRGEGGFGSTGI